MRKQDVVNVALVMAALCVGPGADRVEAEPTSDGAVLVVEVATLRSQKGALGCRLFAAEKGFPETSENTVELHLPITGSTMQCTFRGVAPGRYAVSVMHDENDNHKLDKNVFGVPKEGYGVSNNQTYALRNPRWSESWFEVAAGKRVAVQIKLRY